MASEVVKPWWRETIETILWALALAFLIRTFIIQAFYIPSGSMLPTLQENDRVLVAKFWNWFNEPSRGTVYVFKYPEDRARDFIKRIIAVPGDTVDIRNGVVYINGAPVDEPYVANKDRFTLRPNECKNHFESPDSEACGPTKYDKCTFYQTVPFTVPADQYFTMGDNRPNSQDSRFWGYVSAEDIHGPAFFRYWPLSRIGILR